MRVALDSNVLVYMSDIGKLESDAPKIERARSIVPLLLERFVVVIATQALGELFVVSRRAGVDAVDARRIVLALRETCSVIGTTERTFVAALDLAVNHRLQFWDSLILTASIEAGCDLFLSEDLQDGFVVRGMTVANPFASEVQPKLAALLAG